MAAPGYDLYYLNVMAGPGDERVWRFCDDPAHAWVRGTWEDQPVDPRLPAAPPPEEPRDRHHPAHRRAGRRPLPGRTSGSERDGVERRLFAGCFGIFGHGNVAGVGQALLENELRDPRALPLLPGAQRAGDGPRGGGVRPHEATASRPSSAPPRSAPARRTCSPALPSPPSTACPVAAPAERHLRHASRLPRCCRSSRTRPATTCPSTTSSARCRLLRPGLAAGAAARRRCSARCACSPTRSQAGAVTLALPQDVQAEARDWPVELFAQAGLARRPSGPGAGRAGAGRRGAARPRSDRSSSPAAASSTRRRPTRCARSPRPPASRSPRRRRARARCPTTTPVGRRLGRTGRRRRTRSPATPMSCWASAPATPTSRRRRGRPSRPPGVRFVNLNVTGARRRQALRDVAGRRRPRTGSRR